MDDRGTTSLEYALIGALVSIAGIVALNAMGASLLALMSAAATALATAAGGMGS